MNNKITITYGDRRRDYATRREINAILKFFPSPQSRAYWLAVLVREGKISEARAGEIISISI